MNINIEQRPGSAIARIALDGGETCTTEGGAMVSFSGNLNIRTTTHKKSSGSLLRAAKRLLAGESFFINHYTANEHGGEVILAPLLQGDMLVHRLAGCNIIAQGGSFVACEEHVDLDLGWQGLKSLFSGEGLFWLHCRGRGQVVLSSFGCIYEIPVDGEYIVDSGHIVAFEETLNFSLSKAGKSWLSSFLGGEGLVCRFKGKGKLWVQSHNPSSFGWEIGPRLYPRRA